MRVVPHNDRKVLPRRESEKPADSSRPSGSREDPSSGMTIVSICSEPWSAMWKRHQSMMYHLSLRPDIHRAVFLNPGAWLTGLLFGRGRARLGFGLEPVTWKTVGPHRVGEKLRVITPIHWIPFSRSFRPFARLDDLSVAGQIRRAIGTDDYAVMLSNIETETEPIVDHIARNASVVVFDWSDDFVEFYRDENKRAEVRRLCEKYIRRADLVLTVNERLAARARALNPNSHVLANATNFPVMDRLPPPAGPRRPPEWPKGRGPVVGYLGWINEQRMDLDILDALTRRLSDWSFVFVGPLMFRPENHRAREIFARPNVHYVPPVPYLELPAHLERFDVCILPFLINDHTNGNDPIKIYDYMAFGKSVVSTRTAGIERVERAVRIASDPETFVKMVEQAASPGDTEKSLRISIAAENAWPGRMEQFMRLVREKMPGAHS